MMATSLTPQGSRKIRKTRQVSYLSPTVKKRKLTTDFADTENIGSPQKKPCPSPIKSKPLSEISSKFGIGSFYSKPADTKKASRPVVPLKQEDIADENSNESSGSLSWLEDIGIKIISKPRNTQQYAKSDTSVSDSGINVRCQKDVDSVKLSPESIIQSVINDSDNDDDDDLSSETSSLSDHESSLASIVDFDQEVPTRPEEIPLENASGKKFFRNKESRNVQPNQVSRESYFSQVLSKKIKTPKSGKKMKHLFQKSSPKMNSKTNLNKIAMSNMNNNENKDNSDMNDQKMSPPVTPSLGNTAWLGKNKEALLGTPTLFSDDAKSTVSEADTCASSLPTEDSISLISYTDSLIARHGSNDTKTIDSSTPSTPSTPSMANWPISFKQSPKESPRSSPSRRFLKLKESKDGKSQMILDVGQKSMGTTQCPTCGTFYTKNDPSDEIAHRKFHDRMIATLKFSGWKKEHVVENLPDGSRILTVLPTDPKYATKKLEEIKEIVDKELGFLDESSATRSNRKTFLYISSERKVVGVCIAQEISKAYPVLSNTQVSQESDHQRAWCCSTDSQSAMCGISRIWVFHQARRHGIATRLLDAVRRNFTFGLTLEMSDIAFSDPTPDGKTFATKYTGTPNFLVYKFDHSQR